MHCLPIVNDWCFWLMIRPLAFNQFRKTTIFLNQFFIGPVLQNAPLIQQKNPAAVSDSGKTVGDDNPGAGKGVQRFRDGLLRPVVQGGSGLVEDQDIRFVGDGPRDHDALFLSAGDAASALGDEGLHSHRHAPDVLGDAGQLRGFPGVRQTHPGRGDGDIVVNVSLKQTAVLAYGTDATPERMEVQSGEVLAVVIDGTHIRRLKAEKKSRQRAFPASVMTDQANCLSAPALKTDVIYDMVQLIRVPFAKKNPVLECVAFIFIDSEILDDMADVYRNIFIERHYSSSANLLFKCLKIRNPSMRITSHSKKEIR